MMQWDDGGWLFISHAHEDIEQVRKIRNYLEADGYNPIVFFLKSKTLPWTLNRLIKREIRARKWFVLVDSPASRESKWVQREVRYAEKQKGKIKLTVDLSKDIIPQLKFIVRRTRVFLSYATADRKLIHLIYNKLIKNDYQVWMAEKDLGLSANISDSITSAIKSTKRDGIFLSLITENSIKTKWCLRELEYAVSQGCCVIPVITENVQLPHEWEKILTHCQGVIPFITKASEKDVDILIEQLTYLSGVSS